MTDSAGNIKAESDYYPWGGELQFVNNDSNHYKFTGKERDTESGLDYFGARYYSNGLGRFITPDWAAKATAVPYAEFADPLSLNLYGYVRNVPTTRYDHDGHLQDDKKPPLPGMVSQPSLGQAVEVKAGVCLCAGAHADLGPVEVKAETEVAGAEIKTNLSGNGEAKVNIGKVGVGAEVAGVGAKVEGGVQISTTDGANAAGKATVNGVGVKADTTNGVSTVVEKSGKIGVGAELGAVKVGVSVSPGKVAAFFNALSTNVSVVVGAVIQQMLPGAGTPNVGQTGPPSSPSQAVVNLSGGNQIP